MRGERISGKGELTRKRTVWSTTKRPTRPTVDAVLGRRSDRVPARPRAGRARPDQHGRRPTTAQLYQCATRRLLKTLSTDQRHVVAAGDLVHVPPVAGQRRNHRARRAAARRAQPRQPRPAAHHRHQCRPIADRRQRGRAVSEAEPDRSLSDQRREEQDLRPLIVINKIDLVDRGIARAAGRRLQPDGLSRAAAVGARPASASIACAARWPAAPAPWPGRAASASRRCLTPSIRSWSCASARSATKRKKGATRRPPPGCCRWPAGGYVVDTPGIRQFQLWDVIAEEVAGYFRDLRPFVNHCRFPELHAHARGRLRGQGRRGRRPARCAALRKLLPSVRRRHGVIEPAALRHAV